MNGPNRPPDRFDQPRAMAQGESCAGHRNRISTEPTMQVMPSGLRRRQQGISRIEFGLIAGLIGVVVLAFILFAHSR
jgi:hypothetical protein